MQKTDDAFRRDGAIRGRHQLARVHVLFAATDDECARIADDHADKIDDGLERGRQRLGQVELVDDVILAHHVGNMLDERHCDGDRAARVDASLIACLDAAARDLDVTIGAIERLGADGEARAVGDASERDGGEVAVGARFTVLVKLRGQRSAAQEGFTRGVLIIEEDLDLLGVCLADFDEVDVIAGSILRVDRNDELDGLHVGIVGRGRDLERARVGASLEVGGGDALCVGRHVCSLEDGAIGITAGDGVFDGRVDHRLTTAIDEFCLESATAAEGNIIGADGICGVASRRDVLEAATGGGLPDRWRRAVVLLSRRVVRRLDGVIRACGKEAE